MVVVLRFLKEGEAKNSPTDGHRDGNKAKLLVLASRLGEWMDGE